MATEEKAPPLTSAGEDAFSALGMIKKYLCPKEKWNALVDEKEKLEKEKADVQAKLTREREEFKKMTQHMDDLETQIDDRIREIENVLNDMESAEKKADELHAEIAKREGIAS